MKTKNRNRKRQMASDKIWSIRTKYFHLKLNAKQKNAFPSDVERAVVFPTRLQTCPANQISLCIHAEVFLGYSVGSQGSKASTCGQRRLVYNFTLFLFSSPSNNSDSHWS